MAVTHFLRVVVTVGDLATASAYYRDALGLDVGPEQVTCDPGWNALLGLDEGTTARIAAINFEREQLKLIAFDPPGAPYPQPRASNDQWFEHVALVAGDIESVWKHLENAKTETVTEGAPVLLPPNTGSVTAFKFRDLEGHPLELISFPKGVGDARWQQGGGGLRGYDHTAIAVSDLDRSVAFYRELIGLRFAGRSLNQGPEQDRLDGLSSCLVDVVGPAADRRADAPCGTAPRCVRSTRWMASMRLCPVLRGREPISCQRGSLPSRRGQRPPPSATRTGI